VLGVSWGALSPCQFVAHNTDTPNQDAAKPRTRKSTNLPLIKPTRWRELEIMSLL
jgi:hypothetical protein